MPGLDWLRRCRLIADRTLLRPSKGIVVGGTPKRLWRVSPRADELLDEVMASGRVEALDVAAGEFLARMVRAGMLYPVFDVPRADRFPVAVVVPLFDHAAHVADAVRAGAVIGPVTVVDDASTDAGAEVAREAGARVIRRKENGGPSVARNQGAAATVGDVIVFIDADCVPEPGTLETMLRHFADPALGAVAPRIRERGLREAGRLGRYQEARSPLDLGEEPGPVRPDAKVSYVPTATLAVRRAAFEEVGGFDESLRFGEDVDLVWRLHEAGWEVRYEATVVAEHRQRRRPFDVVRRHWAYGTAAGPLARRHPDALAAVRASPWTMAAWLALLGGRPEVATGLLLWSWWGLRRALDGVPDRGRIGGHLVSQGFLGMARPLAAALVRSWGPLTVAAFATRRRLRWRLGPLIVAGAVMEWWEKRPSLDPATFSILTLVDDLLYCGGVWEGCFRSGAFAPLLPRTGRPRSGRRQVPSVPPVPMGRQDGPRSEN